MENGRSKGGGLEILNIPLMFSYFACHYFLIVSIFLPLDFFPIKIETFSFVICMQL